MNHKLIIFFSCFLFASTVFSQNEKSEINIGKYQWLDVVLIEKLNSDFTALKDAGGNNLSITTLVGQEFRVLKIDGDIVTIIVLDYTTGGDKNSTRTIKPLPNFFKYNFSGDATAYANLTDDEANSRSYGDKQVYFNVKKDLIKKHAREVKKIGGSLAVGVINFPFKFRPQKNEVDFSGAFNFGAGLGWTLPHKSWRKTSHSFITGYSISNVVLDAESVNQNEDKLNSTNNFTAFSFSIGYLIQYDKVQAGLFLGWDRINKINQKEFGWIYQGKPWMSIGFGLAIFSGNNEKEISGDTN